MTTVLHLTDLHFGAEPSGSSSALAQRTNTLETLRETLSLLDGSLRPDIIVVSGDIGWAGRPGDYKLAEDWLRSLLGVLELEPERLIICPGNHDLDRGEADVLERPDAATRADHLLRVEKLVQISRPFSAFEAFARTIGIPPLRVGTGHSYLVGERRIRGIRFVVANTAWFCRDDTDRGKLYIGLPQLEVMEAAGQLLKPGEYDEGDLTVAVLHHPETWLNDNETVSYEGRPATYNYLAQRSHLLLSGHTHGGLDRPRRIGEAGLLFVSGAGYVGGRYRNNVSLLRLDSSARTVERNPFEFDPRDGRWHRREVTTHSLRREGVSPHAAHATAPTVATGSTDYTVLRERAHRHAVRYVEAKSRAVARTRMLPEIHPRMVSIQDRAERVRRRRGEILLREKQDMVPFLEAVASDRPVFLLGDMGSGKSTLVGQLVAEINQRPEGLLGLVIPAKYFLGRSLLDVRAFFEGLDSYVREQIAPALVNFSLREALSQQEITLVLDGVDELDLPAAGALLARAEDAAELYARLRVVATGRPIELRGLDYGRWQLLATLPLSQNDTLLILTEEARADGISDADATNDAQRRLAALQGIPELQEVADTPLVLRLLRPQLSTASGNKTVGDLLLDVLDERLSGWGQREGKEQSRPAFAAAFPDSSAREALIGRIAASVYRSPARTITKHILRIHLEEAVNSSQDRARVIAEGVELLKTAFFEGDEQLTFTSQPLLQCSLGIHIANIVRDGREADLIGSPVERWREVSFAASALRRTGSISGEGFLRDYVDLLFRERGRDATPAAAAVITESQSQALALQVMEHLRRLGFRPLRYFDGRTEVSAAHYAQVFTLAGSQGFEWYFKQYLDARFPSRDFDWFGPNILRHWLALHDYSLQEEESQSLIEAAAVNIATRTRFCDVVLPAIALAAPEFYSAEQRARLAVLALNNHLLRPRAETVLRSLAQAGIRNIVLAALEAAVAKARTDGVEGPALLLWRELSGDVSPSPVIARALLGQSDAGLDYLASSVGVSDIRRLLRWYVISADPIAARAALLLFRDGERLFSLLAPGLLLGIKDRPEVEEVERALEELLIHEGENGIAWLADRIVENDRRYGGAPPALWRLLLNGLVRREKPWPELLRYCLSGLGDHTLPRYPELRRGFQHLLTCAPAYRDTLRMHLVHLTAPPVTALHAFSSYVTPRQKHGQSKFLLRARVPIITHRIGTGSHCGWISAHLY